ncbi:Multi antimicrobial extrusion protein [Corchorus capsularis]|uniref:Protein DETOXIFICATION n=1 Tax=Corchorus capsularis TaxID=210143 RepID=A0A1R3G538_COCAP|nr:Multi antimicrobial extrusion protein [Corchorus capsularis]
MEQEDSTCSFESRPIKFADSAVSYSNINNEYCCNRSGIMEEVKKQMKLAGPLIVVSLLQYGFLMISVMFVGHVGELSLASASMATSFAGMTGFSVMLGMGSALETFCGQAYGAKQYNMVGVHMQRAMLVLALIGLPMSLIWAFTGQIFIILKQDKEISKHAGEYARWMIPSILPYGLLQCQQTFLQAQNNVLPLMISAALSTAISYWINVFILALYIKFSPTCTQTWTGFSIDGRKKLLSFLKLGLPSAFMYCLEFWAYEFLVLMSGLLPNPMLETSMMSISLTISAMVYRILYGFGSAVSIRVSNELGAGKPQAARLAVNVVMFLAVTQGVLLSLIAVAFRGKWGYLFTNEKQLIRYLASIMPILAASNFIDGIQGVLSGTVRGCGWQNLGAYINLGSYYLVGLPSAILLTFVFKIGGKGLWIGIMCGSSLQAFLLTVITMRTNWELQADKARERVYMPGQNFQEEENLLFNKNQKIKGFSPWSNSTEMELDVITI